MTEQRKQAELFERFQVQFDRLTAGENLPSILVALSGGADSVLLLVFLQRLSKDRGFVLEAYHLDHSIRGQQAESDALFCAELCRRLGVVCHLEKEDIPALAAKKKQGLEECARDSRYRRLEEIRSARGLRFIATGHNADDQLETVLFRLARGSSLRGLCGIPEKRGAILRPLLSFESREIRAYCKEHGLCYRVDSTNDDLRYARNEIRKNALPALEKAHKGAARQAYEACLRLKEEEELLSSLVPEGDLTQEELEALHPAVLRRYVEKKYKEYAPEGTLLSCHLSDVLDLVKKGAYGKALSLPCLVKATLYPEGLVFSKDKVEKEGYFVSLLEGEEGVPFPGGRVYLMKKRQFADFWAKNEKIHRMFIKETFNSATIVGTVALRGARRGDCLRTSGMTKKVFSMLGEKKVPLKEREAYPLLVDEAGPLWLPGKAPREGVGDRDGDLVIAVGFDSFAF